MGDSRVGGMGSLIMHRPANVPILEMSLPDLSYWMGKFILEVRKKEGKEYPPKSLYAIVCCFKRFFEQRGVHSINPLSTTGTNSELFLEPFVRFWMLR